MNSKERFDLHVRTGAVKPEEDIAVVKNLVNRLIEALYLPEKERTFSVDPARLKLYKIGHEPINWWDLKVNEVKKSGETYIVVVDEASPGSCPSFCDYIQEYMKAYGWDVEVITEW